MSSWAVAITAASRAVSAPMTTTTVSAELEASNSVWVRATRNTPAVTMVAAWISADTGVGPAMASGSHTYSGICALLPVQARNSSSAMAVAAPAASPETRPKTWSKSSVPNLAKIRKIASRNPTSPMRLAMNAFLAAAGTSGLVNQKPISRYEQRPTPSQPRYMTRKFCASTSVSIAAANRFSHAKVAGHEPLVAAQDRLPGVGVLADQLQNRRHRDPEGRRHQQGGEPAGGSAQAPAHQGVDGEAAQRQQRQQPDQADRAGSVQGLVTP